MRRIAFSMTTRQFLDGSKDVTRRLGWKLLKPGDHLIAVEKGMGLKKGDRQRILGEIEVVSARQVTLAGIDRDECIREGFPGMTPWGFVAMFGRANRCGPEARVTRIEFKHVVWGKFAGADRCQQGTWPAKGS